MGGRATGSGRPPVAGPCGGRRERLRTAARVRQAFPAGAGACGSLSRRCPSPCLRGGQRFPFAAFPCEAPRLLPAGPCWSGGPGGASGRLRPAPEPAARGGVSCGSVSWVLHSDGAPPGGVTLSVPLLAVPSLCVPTEQPPGRVPRRGRLTSPRLPSSSAGDEPVPTELTGHRASHPLCACQGRTRVPHGGERPSLPSNSAPELASEPPSSPGSVFVFVRTRELFSFVPYCAVALLDAYSGDQCGPALVPRSQHPVFL